MSERVVRTHPDCLLHRPGLGHPESPGRLEELTRALEASEPCPWHLQREAPLADVEDAVGCLRWIHDPGYLERLSLAGSSGPDHVDSPDCAISPGSWGSIVAAARLSLQAGLDCVNGRLQRAFLALRPPSHHAERDRARGYCFVNSVALVAEVFARAAAGPVLIVDIDAHHGNGTQSLFWERDDVAYVSVHEWPAFPGTGAGDEIGAGRGRGLTRNVPLAAGADDAVFATAVEVALEEMAARVRPVSLVVSAGFSGHRDDPVANWNLTEGGYARASRALVQAAEAFTGGRIVSLLEGGYNPKALADSALQHVRELIPLEDVN